MTAVQFIRLEDAHFCASCNCVTDSTGACPRCTSRALVHLNHFVVRIESSAELTADDWCGT